MNRRSIIILLIVLILVAGLVFIFASRNTLGSRSAKLYPFDPTQIKSVDFITHERRTRIEFKDGHWMLVAPVRDFTERDTMLRIFGVLQDERRPTAKPGISRDEWGRYGLDWPELELRFGRGHETDTLRFGALDPESHKLWTCASWTDSLILVPTLLRTQFLRNRYALSDKRPVMLRRLIDVRSLEVENDHGAYTLRPNDFGWEIVAAGVFRADPEKVRELIHQVAGPTILDFLDGEGRRPVEISPSGSWAKLDVYVEGELDPHRLEIGRSFHELYLAVNPARGRPFLLDSLTCAPLLASLNDYLARSLFEILPGRVESIESGDRRIEIAQGSEKAWIDQDGKAPALREVSRLIAFLSGISTDKLEALIPREDQLRRWGLDPPEAIIAFRERGRDLRLEIGSPVAGRRYFRRGDYPPVYSLPREALEFRWPGDSASFLDR